MKKNRIIVLLLVLALLLTGCADMIDDSAVRADAQALLESFVSNDPQVCRSLLNDWVADEDLEQVFAPIASELADLGSYSMTVVNWQFQSKDGVTTNAYRYQIDGESGSYYLDVTVVEGEPGIAGFHLSSAEGAAPAAKNPAGPLHWAFLAVGLVGLGFVIWMLVDYAKRKMKRKWLWILLILLLTVLLTFTVNDGNINFRFNIGAFLGITSITTYAAGGFEAHFYIPLGALVYFFKRRDLTLVQPQPETETTEDEL